MVLWENKTISETEIIFNIKSQKQNILHENISWNVQPSLSGYIYIYTYIYTFILGTILIDDKH